MPSEKLRYLKLSCGPSAPLEWKELKEQLPKLGIDRLADILIYSSESHHILRKLLTGTLGIQLANGEWEKAKGAIDYALHFPDYIRYTECGHGQIIEEIRTSLELLAAQEQDHFAIRIAEYAIDKAQSITENFEDDREWTSSLENLREWVDVMKLSKKMV